MSANTLLASEFNTANLVVSKFQPNKDSGTGNIQLRYNYKPDEPDRLVMQSARMRVPFGISNNEKYAKDGDNLKWTMQVSIEGEEKNKKVRKFRKFLEDFDDHFLELGLANAEEWIGDDEADAKSIKKSYKGALKKFKVKKEKPDVVFPDTFKISIPWDYDKDAPRSNIEFYDENGKETEWTDVTPGCEVIALFAINGVWCSPGLSSYGPSIKLVQLQIFKPKKIKGFNIKYDKDSDDESSDEEEEETASKEAEEDDIEEYESE
jgi:hypothetical protein